MANILTHQALQAFINAQEQILEHMAIYDTVFVLTTDTQEWVLSVDDTESEDSFFEITDFISINGEVSVKVKRKPANKGNNEVVVEEHKIGAALQVFSNWAATRESFHELMEKLGKKRKNKKFKESSFIESWNLTEADEEEQFNEEYKLNLIGYSKFIEDTILSDASISEPDKKEFSDGIKHFQQTVNEQSKAETVRHLAKIMLWVEKRSKQALNIILNGAADFIVVKGIEKAIDKAPVVIDWIQNFINGSA